MLPIASVRVLPVLPQTWAASSVIIKRGRAAMALIGTAVAELMPGLYPARLDPARRHTHPFHPGRREA